MAGRNIKIGLDYFPVDIDFFDDDKIQLISAEFGIKGEVITLRLLAKIYSTNGYFYQWGNDESALFAKRVGDSITGSFVNEVVNGLVRRGFFNKSVFDSFGILTSRGIQKRYFIAAERRKKIDIISQISLLDDAFFIDANINYNYVNINSNNVDISTQSKVKESKVKESKVNKASLALPFSSENFLTLWEKLIVQPKWKNKTIDALDMALKKLGAVAEPVAVKMMEDAIAGGWQGVFEPRTAATKQNSTAEQLDETKFKKIKTDEYGRKIG